ncbi:MAG TPA: DNA-processing protein DprA [Anaerolineaceae bacterium]|nr:DNA-processing protein DprA [Anaerolineaceae bacterium]
MVKGIGAVRLQALLNYFGDPQVAWQAPADALLNTGLSPKIVDSLVHLRATLDLEKVMDRLGQLKVTVITREEDSYPRRLKEIEQPPPVIYVRGEILPEDDFAVAVVGTRRITVYGRQVAEEIGTFLAQNGITVVSGLARGVDAVAHDSAIKAGGRTFAVLGCGVDRIYPPEHQRLAERIMECGALISDYAPGTPPDAINFPPRNRIIAGLSLASVVVEAGETSGALITATFAADQGRDVLAVPGNINAPQSKGANRLIQQGARPLLKVEDILDALKLDHVQSLQQARQVLPSDALEASILVLMSAEPIHVDEISSQSGLSIDKVSATLTMLELKGLVRQVGGMNYISVREPGAHYWTDDHV